VEISSRSISTYVLTAILACGATLPVIASNITSTTVSTDKNSNPQDPKTYQTVTKNLVASLFPLAIKYLGDESFGPSQTVTGSGTSSVTQIASGQSFSSGQILRFSHDTQTAELRDVTATIADISGDAPNYTLKLSDALPTVPQSGDSFQVGNTAKSDAWCGWTPPDEDGGIDLLNAWKDGSQAPVFLDASDETSGTYSDWNGLNGAIEWAQGNESSSSRWYILVAVKSSRLSYYSYAPDGNGSYDLSVPPVKRTFTREQEIKHWNQLPPKSANLGLGDLKRYAWLLGFSPSSFKVGDTKSSGSQDANSTFYMLGGEYLLNPYAGINVGITTGDGHKFSPTFGFNLDVSIVSQIFGTGK
jgi:hypothetical protein